MVGTYDDAFETPSEVHLVWVDPQTGALVYLAGEEDITDAFLDTTRVDLVVNVNHATAPQHVERMRSRTRHSWLPFYDAAPHMQEQGFKANAGRAVLEVMTAIEKGESVLVHCRAGIHRSPAVVYAALVKLGRVRDRFEAYQKVNRVRPYARLYKTLVKWVEHAADDELRYKKERAALEEK